MAEQKTKINSGFFDSVDNDRLYSADEMNRPYKRVITEGVFATPAGTPSTDLQVLSANSGMNIIVKKGEGLLGGKWFENPKDFKITVPKNNDISPRRDSVIIQVDKRISGREVNIVYREGIPSANPQVPDISVVETIVEYRVANIYVAPGATNINQDAIVDLRGSSECPWITSLIKQVDTSTLYDQYRAAYDDYYKRETELFNDFMKSLTSELTVSTNIIKYESHYISTTDGETQIPINIPAYNKNGDVLLVRVNRLFASEGTDYTISSDGTYITLTKDVYANQNIDFIVLQSVFINADTQTIIESIQGISTSILSLNTDVTTLKDDAQTITEDISSLNTDVNTLKDNTQNISRSLTSLNTDVNALKDDSGWITFTLEGGATAFDNNHKPAVRKFGNMTSIRGAIKGVTETGTTICTLPAAYKPAMDYYFTTSAIASGTVKSTVTFQVLASNGTVKLVAKSGTIATTDMISIATNFIIG